MKHILKIASVLCACTMLFVTLIGCGHAHEPTMWGADVMTHWRMCGGCDEKLERGEHSMEGENCAVCGAAVYRHDDGTATVICYDEQGGLAMQSEYDAQGNELGTFRVDSVYDENGNMQSAKHYYDGVLSSEEKYAVCKNPEDGVYLAESTEYFDDGMKNVVEYDEAMYVLRSVMYNADGKVLSEETHDYAFDENGNCLKDTAYTDGVITSVAESFVAPSGEVLQCRTEEYDGGELRVVFTYEYEYAQSGEVMRKTEYTDGVMTNDTVYAFDEDGNRYLVKDIYYDEEGAVTEESYFDADGNEILPEG